MLNEIFKNFPDFDNPLCAEVDPELWFPETSEERRINTPHAKSICGRCDHQVDCLKYAVDHAIPDGIWGGQTERERTRFQPRKASGRVAHSKGARAVSFKQQGYTNEEIGHILGIKADSVVTAIIRYKKAVERINR